LYKYFTSITDLREVVIQITVGKRWKLKKKIVFGIG
jgi:hypothetical protein